MKKYSLLKQNLILLAMLASPAVFAQDTNSGDGTKEPAKPAKKEVKSTFENGVLINNQTVMTTPRKSLEFMIQHRFGVIEDGTDLYGIFGPSNIRIGLDYGITKRLAVGIGATKDKSLYGLDAKYALAKQTEHGCPVSVAAFGHLERSNSPKTAFQIKDANRTDKDTTMYESYDRFSYFGELMIARKINEKISLQIGASWSHVNLVDSGMKHDIIGAHFAGRYKFSPQSSILLEFDYPLVTHDVNKNKPNLGIGYEVATSGHSFQIFVCTSDGINNQEIMVYNTNDFTKRQIRLGFNITRLWGF